MIIRLSEKNDIPDIINLWNEAFGDSEKEIRFFLDNKYVSENTLIAEDNGGIASMLFLLEGNMRIDNKTFPSYYLYAACTAKKFRGRGYMADLLREASCIARQRNKDFICLMPGEKSLFGFYEKHGYVTAFGKKTVTLDARNCGMTDIPEETDEADLAKLRNKAFDRFDFFEWDSSSVRFALAHNEFYSGKAIKTCKGYLLYSVHDNTANVKEFAFEEDDFDYGISLLFSSCRCDKLVINLPGEYKIKTGKSEILPSAMLYPVNNEAELAAQSLHNAYLGLTLD